MVLKDCGNGMNCVGCIGDCGEDVLNFYFVDVMEIMEEVV